MFVISRDTCERGRIQPQDPHFEPRQVWASAARKSLVAERGASGLTDASAAQSTASPLRAGGSCSFANMNITHDERSERLERATGES
jgi:hypothetical protein